MRKRFTGGSTIKQIMGFTDKISKGHCTVTVEPGFEINLGRKHPSV